MTPAQARDRVLHGIADARHVEPFTWNGMRLGVRVPDRCQLMVASTVAKQSTPAAYAASLAVQCTELNGALIFSPHDVAPLIHDEPYGFMVAFWSALVPLLTEPPVIPEYVLRRAPELVAMEVAGGEVEES